MGNYPPGVTDSDPYFDMPSVHDDEGEEELDLYTCPWCMKDNQTTDQIRKCSGFKPSGMPANETGHPYGCSCRECFEEYRKLK